MVQTINTNQFAQSAIKGMLAKDISKSGVVAGIIDGAAYPGMPVALNTGAFNKPIPVFTTVSTSEEPFGVIIYNARKSTLAANDAIEVAFHGGPVVWMESAAAIAAFVSAST